MVRNSLAGRPSSKAPRSKIVESNSDSDSEGFVPELSANQALGLFKDLVKSAAKSTQNGNKRRKLNSATLKAAPSSQHNGRSANTVPRLGTPKVEKVQSNGSTRKSKTADPVARVNAAAPIGRSKLVDDDRQANIWQTMQDHQSRKLSEASIEDLQGRKWERIGEEPYQQCWPSATWMTNNGPFPAVAKSLSAYGIKPRLAALWQERHPGAAEELSSESQCCLLALMRSYKDILLSDRAYLKGGEEDEVMDAALLHCLDHISATAQCIKKNNETLKAQPEMDTPQDQGFTRPKVLILLPMRNMAYRVVTRLLSFAQKETRTDSIQNKRRFHEEFGPNDLEEESPTSGQPSEHVELFKGNTDDHFSLGIKLTKGAVKLYADFYQSDIIVASPLGLVTKRAEGEEDALQDLDYLSSIDIVLADRCDVCQMQNWAHMVTAFEAINQMPKESHGGDIMRIQEWRLSGQSKLYRQNILLSSHLTPELNALFSLHCHSHAGKAKLQVTHTGVLDELASQQVRQIFQRLPAQSPASEPEQRLAYFKAHVWPRLRDTGAGQMIFVSSYFDYVRLRSFLREQQEHFEGLTEYADGSEVARGRHRFSTGKTRIAVYTERSHFYHRGRTKGVRDLLFYQLPQHAQFYRELIEAMDPGDISHATVTVLFSKFDAMRLERIVGSSRCPKMLANKSGSFLFC